MPDVLNDVIAMVLAGGRVGELGPLTMIRPKSAVPFAGIYRIIDFPLTNLMRSGVQRVGVLSQYRSSSLIEHVGIGEAWNLSGRRRGVKILPPYRVSDTGSETDWYRGTSDAIFHNLNYITAQNPELVMVLSGDHVYSMDFYPMIRFHKKVGASMTMGLVPVKLKEAGRFGVAQLDQDSRVLSYEEKPENPSSNLASMTIYIFNRDTLIRRIVENNRDGTTYQIYSEVIPRMIEDGERVYGYVFDGYWNYTRTPDEYFRASMDVLGKRPNINLQSWQVRTKMKCNRLGDLPPARFEKGCNVTNSLISDGCVIEGTVSDCVLSPGVYIKSGAVVENSVIIHDCTIAQNAVVKNSILDKGVRVAQGCVIGEGDKRVRNREMPDQLRSGLTIVGRGTFMPVDLTVGTNCMLHPNLEPDDFVNPCVPDGTTVRHVSRLMERRWNS